MLMICVEWAGLEGGWSGGAGVEFIFAIYKRAGLFMTRSLSRGEAEGEGALKGG